LTFFIAIYNIASVAIVFTLHLNLSQSVYYRLELINTYANSYNNKL